jgi:hypothetical protein
MGNLLKKAAFVAMLSLPLLAGNVKDAKAQQPEDDSLNLKSLYNKYDIEGMYDPYGNPIQPDQKFWWGYKLHQDPGFYGGTILLGTFLINQALLDNFPYENSRQRQRISAGVYAIGTALSVGSYILVSQLNKKRREKNISKQY